MGACYKTRPPTYLGVSVQPLKKFRRVFERFILKDKKILILYYSVLYVFMYRIIFFYMPDNLSCSSLRKFYLPDPVLSVCYAAPLSLSQPSNLATTVSKLQTLAGFLEEGSNISGQKW